MRDLNEIQIFIAVADRLNFDAAARNLGLSASTVSRRVRQLEARLGVPLLRRTTRSVRLTEAGETYRARCDALLEAAARADAAVASYQDSLRGALCINAPRLFGRRVLAPLAAAFAAAHPGLRLHVGLTNTYVDPEKTGCDVVIRTGPLPDSGLRARLLARAPMVIVASPALLAGRDPPARPEDLRDWPCIVFGQANERRWRNCGPGPLGLAVDARFTTDDLETVRDAVMAGLGLAVLPRFAVDDLIARDALRVVPASAALAPTPLHTVFPAHPIENPAAQAFAEHLRRALASAPGWTATEA
jgi:DNA-binding transcriptional LysR family regulator